MNKLIKSIEIPEYANVTIPPMVEKIDLYKDRMILGEGREIYFEDYLIPCLLVMDFNKPVAKIKLLRKENSSVNFDYEIHFCAKSGMKEETRKFAFDLYSEIQKIFDKIK